MPVLRLAVSGSSSLWLGDDHLLRIETVYYNETYKRYFYHDIQATLLRESSRGLVYSSILGTLLAGFALLAWSMNDETARAVCVGWSVFWLVLLLVNLLRGNTCSCQLLTASGPHPLRSLNRLRPARKTLRLIAEKIEAVQGALTPEDAARQMDMPTR